MQPGLIDSDYTGPIKIMVRVLNPPIIIPKGSKIAQLIPFYCKVPHSDSSKVQGSEGFGSTGPLVAFMEILSPEKPLRKATISMPQKRVPLSTTTIQAQMMMDTGSDIW